MPREDGSGFEFREAGNPNRPDVDPKSRAVGKAVVFLRGVDSVASRLWDLPPVRVEIGGGQITVIQGGKRGRVGFVRRGDAITLTSIESAYQVLRGRGAAFFSLPFPEPRQSVSRTLSGIGRVELSSGTGLYWARADLFVTDHPYFTLTDDEGRFAFDRVPSGDVEVCVWMPGWQPARLERDPDSTQVARQSYSPPIQRSTKVTGEACRTTVLDISVP